MTILHREGNNEGVFYLEENGEALAEMVYKKEKGKMIIQHTEVDESLKGKNIGFQLVERGVDYAREAHLKIVPLCTFAKKVIERNKQFADLL